MLWPNEQSDRIAVKVAVQCESPLLQRSLESFLSGHLSSLKQCDVVIRDRRVDDGHTMLYVGSSADADLVKPFSRSQLMMALEQLFKDETTVQEIKELTDAIEAMEPAEVSRADKMDFTILEKRIEMLTQEYQTNIIKAVRAFYEG